MNEIYRKAIAFERLLVIESTGREHRYTDGELIVANGNLVIKLNGISAPTLFHSLKVVESMTLTNSNLDWTYKKGD